MVDKILAVYLQVSATCGLKGKMVKGHHGPAAVIGDESCSPRTYRYEDNGHSWQ
jgi:hypothetical protein